MWKFWPISSKEPEVSGLLEHFLPPKLSPYMWFKNICNLCAFEMCSFNPTNIWCKIIAQLNVQQMFQKPKKHSQNTAGKFITALGSFDLYYVEGQYYLMYVCWYRARGQGICEFHSTKISPLSYLPVINAADFFFFSCPSIKMWRREIESCGCRRLSRGLRFIVFHSLYREKCEKWESAERHFLVCRIISAGRVVWGTQTWCSSFFLQTLDLRGKDTLDTSKSMSLSVILPIWKELKQLRIYDTSLSHEFWL